MCIMDPITEKDTIPLMTDDQKLLKLSSLFSPARNVHATFMHTVHQLIQFNLTIHTFLVHKCFNFSVSISRCLPWEMTTSTVVGFPCT